MKVPLLSMKLKTFVIIVFFLLLYIPLRPKVNFPITEKEAKEAYTAYTILITGKDPDNKRPFLFPTAGGQYLSPMSVYSKVLTLKLFGLNDLGVRIGAAVLGFLSILMFYLVMSECFKDTRKVFVVTLLLFLSPLFLRYSLFDFAKTSSLFFCLTAIYYDIKNKKYIVYASSTLAVLSTFEALPFVITVIIFKDFRKRKKLKVFLKLAVVIMVIFFFFKFNPSAYGYLQKNSFIYNLKPANYTYLIDKRLSFGKIINSPLITSRFNFNRLVHNKIFYFVSEIFKLPIHIFNFELLSSSFQSKTILMKENVDSLFPPSVFVWEWFLIFPGVILLLRRKDEIFLMLFAGGIATSLLFPGNLTLLLIPSFLISEITFLYFIVGKVRYKKFVIVGYLSLFIFSIFSFLDIFLMHKDLWMNENDLRQFQIWNFISPDMVHKNNIIETDRLGEPAFYYLYYHKVNPKLYYANSEWITLSDFGDKRLEVVGNVRFVSFKFYEDKKPANYIWIGMPGEFIGENAKYDNINAIDGGVIINKINGVKVESKVIGNDLLFVKT